MTTTTTSKTPQVRAPARSMTVSTVALLTAASIVTSLRGLPVMGKEELTMLAYIAFATVLFLIPAALVSAELRSAFGARAGAVYTWVGEAFGGRWGFVAIWLQWIQNVVWSSLLSGEPDWTPVTATSIRTRRCTPSCPVVNG